MKVAKIEIVLSLYDGGDSPARRDFEAVLTVPESQPWEVDYGRVCETMTAALVQAATNWSYEMVD